MSRIGRLRAVTATFLRSLIVASIGAAALAWFWNQASPAWFAGPFAMTAWQTARSTRTFRRRGRHLQNPHYETIMPAPPGVADAVADLAPRFALRAKRITIVVQRYGKGKARDLNLAAAAGWLGGGLLIVDDNLAEKSLQSRPGDADDNEVRGAVAHELGHIYGLHSALVSANAFTLAALTTVCVFGAAHSQSASGSFERSVLIAYAVALAFGLLVCRLAALWVSRMCEYAADTYAAKVLRDGNPLAAALAHDFGSGHRGWRVVFDEHPSQHKRIARLKARAKAPA